MSTVHPETDDPEQARLRALRDEMAAFMQRHELGGTLVLVSRDAATWHFELPSWSVLAPDPEHGIRLRVRLRKDEPETARALESTIHLFAAVVDTCSDLARTHRRLLNWMVSALRGLGIEVDQPPLARARFGEGGRPDPQAGDLE